MNRLNSTLELLKVDPMACAGYERFSRRKLLSLLTGATFGSAWLTLLAEHLTMAADVQRTKRPKSLLIIWLQGGPSQLETFDPHPGTIIGGDVESIPTKVRGVELASTMPATAEQLHRALLVRGVVSKEGDHERATYHLKTGWRPDPTIVHPSLGAIICHQSENNIEIPRHISILPSQWAARGGDLGPAYDAFQIGDPAHRIANLISRVDSNRMQNRVEMLLDTLEKQFERGRMRDLDRSRTLHQTATNNAVKMMNSDQLSAFQIDQEPDEVRKRFGDTPFGRGCLAAVRLLGAGVRCVEVELNGWDSHINNHEIQSRQAAVLDKGLAATLSELAARDLLEDTVVFCGGEFGRTPLINPAGGRDHWPHGFSVLLAGGRFRQGYVHGATASNPDRKSLEPISSSQLTSERWASDTISVPDLHATLLTALGVEPTTERITPIGRPFRWSDGEVAMSLLQ